MQDERRTVKPPLLSSIALLPSEILTLCLSHLRYDDHRRAVHKRLASSLDCDLADVLIRHALPAQRDLARAARVNRLWNASASDVLYTEPILDTVATLLSLCLTIQSRAHLATRVRRLDVTEVWERAPGYYMQYFSDSAAHHFNGSICSIVGSQLQTIIALSPHIYEIRLLPMGSNPSCKLLHIFIMNCARSPIANEYPSRAVPYAITLSGDVPIELRKIVEGLPRLRSLRKLEFRNLVACALNQLEFPELESFSIVRCTFLGNNDYSRLIPRAAPRLEELRIVHNTYFDRGIQIVPKELPRNVLQRFASSLRKLTLVGGREVGLMFADGGEWLQRAETLRAVALGQDAWEWGCLPLFPANLHSLTLLGSKEKTVYCFGPSDDAELCEMIAADGGHWQSVFVHTLERDLGVVARSAFTRFAAGGQTLRWETLWGSVPIIATMNPIFVRSPTLSLSWRGQSASH